MRLPHRGAAGCGRSRSEKSGHRAPGASTLAASGPAPTRVQRHLDPGVATLASASPVCTRSATSPVPTSSHPMPMPGIPHGLHQPSILPGNLSALGECARHTFISNTHSRSRHDTAKPPDSVHTPHFWCYGVQLYEAITLQQRGGGAARRRSQPAAFVSIHSIVVWLL